MTKDAVSGPTPPQTIDVLSPYYLGSHDVPGLSITHVQLRSDNYEEWSRSMRQSLKSRRKFGFVDGTIKQPTDDFYLDQWVVVQCTLVQWIMRSIDPSVKGSISYFEDAKLLWDDLAERFSTVDGAKIHDLKEQLHNCIQTKGMSITDYFGKLKTLWDAIAAHEPVFHCSCGHCTCGITIDAPLRQDKERLHKFLMSLDLSLYANIRSHILALDPLSPLNRAYQMLLQEERLRTSKIVVSDTPTETMAYAVRPSTRAEFSATPDWRTLRDAERVERRKLVCSFCTGTGHESSNCFIRTKKFPDWWGDRPRTVEEVKARHRARTESDASTSARANVLIAATSSSINDRLSGPFIEDEDWSW